jgi:hypothetical protein
MSFIQDRLTAPHPFGGYNIRGVSGLATKMLGGTAGGGGTPGALASSMGNAAATPGNLAGAPAFNYSGAYGGIPQVPSPGTTQQAALGGNLANFSTATDLASQVNAFNNQQAVAPYLSNLPGYQQMNEQASANIGANLAGQVPDDVWRQLQQRGAERGVAMGSPGSANANAAMMRALGLTSLDLQNQGQAQFGQAMARTPVAPMFNPASMFTTPEQWQAAQAAANMYAAAPIPSDVSAANMAALAGGLGGGQRGTGMSQPSYFPIPTSMMWGGGASTGSVNKAPYYSGPTTPQGPNPNQPSTYYAPPPRYESQPSNYSVGMPVNQGGALASALEVATSPSQLGGYKFGSGSNWINDWYGI